MWIRMRLDIGWLDLLSGLVYCITPDKHSVVDEQARQSWSCQQNFMITLSVRSAFDLTLRALQLPPKSEVLLSALTVPDMVRIVQMHGLIPVPLDTDEVGNIRAAALRQAISSRTRMVVAAHLFGGCVPLDDLLEIARQYNLLVVEDYAQSFRRVGESGHPATDVAMFSFGPIKTASALGGAVVRVSSPELAERMAKLLKNDSIQSRLSFARRLIRFATLKSLSGRRAASLFRCCTEYLGYDFDLLANSVARGFHTSDLLVQLRRQPSTPLLRLLRRRWRSYNFGRIERRIQMGRHLDSRLGLAHAASHSYWAYPLFVNDPIAMRDRLRAAGYDATCRARMTVVPATDKSRLPTLALYNWQHVLFLPWYPEMPDEAVDEMASVVRSAGLEMDRPPDGQNNTMHGEPPKSRDTSGMITLAAQSTSTFRLTA